MAVYRSDQAQLTFGVEAAQGADPEMWEGTAVSSGATGLLKGDSAAGTRNLLVDTVAAAVFVVGDFIRIGTLAGTAAATVNEHEVRRIELIEGDNTIGTPGDGVTFVLDRPTAFWHADNETVIEVTSVIGGDATRNDQGKMITWIPGVYETVDTPDPEMSIEGKRFLGTQSKRNWSVAYPGQQTLSGSVSGIVLLNGWPLRFPIGKVVTTPSSVASAGLSLAAAAVKKYAGITTIIKLIASHNEPIPPVDAEPIIHAKIKAASAIAIFKIFILFPYFISYKFILI